MRTLKIAAAAVAAGALAVAGSAIASADPAPNDAADGPAVHQAADTQAEQDQIRDAWTPERMEAAVPMDGMEVSADEVDVDVPLGDELVVEPTEAETQAFPEGGAPWTDGGEVVDTSGRVFFNFDGQDSSCSGNAVTSENGNTVLTAGHCVKLEGSWHTEWMFVPGYDNGDAPHGEWVAEETMATSEWDASEDISYDVGAAVVTPPNGEDLSDVVGAQGVAFNTDYGIDKYAFGFPAADPYDGEELIYCSGTTIEDPLGLSTAQGMDCDMTGGSSGGPWFEEFDEDTGTGLQSSVNSFGYIFLPDVMFGPVFGESAEDLYNTAQAS